MCNKMHSQYNTGQWAENIFDNSKLYFIFSCFMSLESDMDLTWIFNVTFDLIIFLIYHYLEHYPQPPPPPLICCKVMRGITVYISAWYIIILTRGLLHSYTQPLLNMAHHTLPFDTDHFLITCPSLKLITCQPFKQIKPGPVKRAWEWPVHGITDQACQAKANQRILKQPLITIYHIQPQLV